MKGKEKLPKWAQLEIQKLEGQLKTAEEVIASRDSQDSMISWRHVMNRHGIPDHATVEFHIDDARIDVSVVDGALRITSSSSMLSVLPRASNSFWVKAAE